MTDAGQNPERLSDWGMLLLTDQGLTPNEGVVAYGLETPLFSDYAQKLRTIWLPEGASVPYTEGMLDYPVGTVLTKTFYYPEAEDGSVLAEAAADAAAVDPATHRIVETRVLVRRADGWEALVYLWNEAETEAVLSRAGGRVDLTLARADGSRQAFTYAAPNVTQCAACHAPNATTRRLSPIGPSGRHLNRDYPYAAGGRNQLAQLAAVGWVTGAPEDLAEAPRLVAWTDETAPLDDRARAYLSVNCAHCHNAAGPADTSGLMLEAHAPFGRATGLCKLPVAAGAGTGDLQFDIVPGQPDQSILIYRLYSEDPAVMMPEIGRAVAHREGAALLSGWIAAMEGRCS
jgi:uncharacterized repeat protein (TIGR03806 family)